MNRTRTIFFAVAAIFLAILVYALAGQALHTPTLLRLYIASTVFAGGVVLLDFAGLLGHDASGHDFGALGHDASAAGHDFANFSESGGHAGHDFAAGHDLAAGGHEAGGHDAGALAQGDTSVGTSAHDAAGAATAAAATDHGANGHDTAAAPAAAAATAAAATQHSPAARGADSSNPAPILSVLAYLRLAVYFCLGFGPVGWAALATGRSPLASLAFAVPAGVAAVFLARAFFRFQRQDTGAVAPEAELVGERATVLVPLSDRVMGKVRVEAGMNVEELYAQAADPGRAFERGDSVRIVRVTDECVQVR